MRYIVILSTSYCNVFSPVNETRVNDSVAFNPPAMPSLVSQVSLWSVGAHEAWLWRVICREGGILCFQN